MGGLVTEVESERVNPVNAGCISLKPGSIPACAGEPAVAAIGNYCRPVYPRVCGGTHACGRSRHGERGLSPACAGESSPPVLIDESDVVYPRVCGGICLVFNHEASHGNGLVYCHTAPDHRLEGPGPTAEVTGP